MCEVSHACVKGDLEPVLWEEQQRLHVSPCFCQPRPAVPVGAEGDVLPDHSTINGPGSSFGPKASDETKAQQ